MKNLWRSCFAFTSSSLIGTSNSLLLCILGLTIILYLSDTWSWSWSTQCNGDRLFHFPNITSQLISLFLLLGLLMKNLWRSCFAFTSSSLIGTSNSLLLCILGLTIILYLSDTWSWSWSGPSSKRGQFFLMITMVTINF